MHTLKRKQRDDRQSSQDDIQRKLADPRRADRRAPKLGVVTHDVDGEHELRSSLASVASQRTTATLKGKVAIVTGSTSGIGLGVLAGQAADIVLNGLGDASAIETICGGIERAHGGADLPKGDAARRWLAATAEIGLWIVFAAFVCIAVSATLSCLAG